MRKDTLEKINDLKKLRENLSDASKNKNRDAEFKEEYQKYNFLQNFDQLIKFLESVKDIDFNKFSLLNLHYTKYNINLYNEFTFYRKEVKGLPGSICFQKKINNDLSSELMIKMKNEKIFIKIDNEDYIIIRMLYSFLPFLVKGGKIRDVDTFVDGIDNRKINRSEYDIQSILFDILYDVKKSSSISGDHLNSFGYIFINISKKFFNEKGNTLKLNYKFENLKGKDKYLKTILFNSNIYEEFIQFLKDEYIYDSFNRYCYLITTPGNHCPFNSKMGSFEKGQTFNQWKGRAENSDRMDLAFKKLIQHKNFSKVTSCESIYEFIDKFKLEGSIRKNGTIVPLIDKKLSELSIKDIIKYLNNVNEFIEGRNNKLNEHYSKEVI